MSFEAEDFFNNFKLTSVVNKWQEEGGGGDPTRVNAEELKRTMKSLEASPESWDQNYWVHSRESYGEGCGTTYCFAGMTCHLAGLVDEVNVKWIHNNFWAQNAARILGLTEAQGWLIFNYAGAVNGRTLDDFKEHITEVTGVVFE